jgi:glycine/D-amino acid oxidase-like deaminating enzyme
VSLRSGQPYWLSIDQPTATEPPYRPLVGDATCSVVVLGGGITGALVAHHLGRSGVDVLLIDERDFGQGSTAASTGLLQYEVDTPLEELIKKVGEEKAVRAYRRGLKAIDEIEQLVAEVGESCGFIRRESLYFASSLWHRRTLQRECELRKKFGFDVEFLSRDELREITTIPAAGAIRSHGDAEINPYRLTRSLVRQATEHGVRAHAGTKVLEVRETDQRVELTTETGTIFADKIVYATGYLTKPFIQTREIGKLRSTYAVISEARPEWPGWPNQCLIWETARPYFYARQTPDGRALIGGEDTSFASDHRRDELVERKIKKLGSRFEKLFPDAKFVPAMAWAGTFAETKDGLAYIGQPVERPRAFFALGYGGNGITYSMIAARLIADLYLGRPNADADVFRFGR